MFCNLMDNQLQSQGNGPRCQCARSSTQPKDPLCGRHRTGVKAPTNYPSGLLVWAIILAFCPSIGEGVHSVLFKSQKITSVTTDNDTRVLGQEPKVTTARIYPQKGRQRRIIWVCFPSNWDGWSCVFIIIACDCKIILYHQIFIHLTSMREQTEMQEYTRDQTRSSSQ